MNLLALDQSVKRTGWCVMEPRPMGQFKLVGHGWFGAQGPTNEDQVNLFIDTVDALILDYQVAAMFWEKPSAFVGHRGVNARTLVLTRLDQALRDLGKQRHVACSTVAANSWRAKVLGKGAGRLTSEKAKERALQWCAMMRIQVSNADQAEAICIGCWACACSGLWEVA